MLYLDGRCMNLSRLRYLSQEIKNKFTLNVFPSVQFLSLIYDSELTSNDLLHLDLTDSKDLVALSINYYSAVSKVIFRKIRSKQGELVPILRISNGYERDLVNEWVFQTQFSKNFHYIIFGKIFREKLCSYPTGHNFKYNKLLSSLQRRNFFNFCRILL